MTVKLEYKSMSEVEHVLHRPDTFIGSVVNSSHKSTFVALQDDRIIEKDVTYPPGLVRIFIEILSNVIDNKWRSDQMGIPCKQFKVSIDKETGVTRVVNDGNTIPVEMKDGGKYLPEQIFGRFRTSSNYNDSEERKTSGRNGLGSKLANIFSSSFTFKTYDRHTSTHYSQRWTNNMSNVGTPKITSTKKTPYTMIEWIPDFKRFGLDGYTDDIIDLFRKYTYDAAMITGIPTHFNNHRIPIKKLADYARLYIRPECTSMVVPLNTGDSKVVVCPSAKGEFVHISFVNGIQTPLGGVHVDIWTENIFRPIVSKINKKYKSKFTITDILKYFTIFVVTEINNPTFTTQSKEKLSSPRVDDMTLPDSIRDKIMKWEFMEDIKETVDSKKYIALKKTDGKKSKHVKVDGYDRANKSGGTLSTTCSLILSEGLSAKTYAVEGIGSCGLDGRKGRDWFGIYALRGKTLNVTNATPSQIEDNKVLSDIRKIMGLKYGTDYSEDTNYRSLNYGRIIILCDADHDGNHIKGLIINFLVAMYPSLVKRAGFLTSIETPIAKVSCRGGTTKLFYDISKYNKFQEENKNQIKSVKYYKGLGASTKTEIKETFGRYVIHYITDTDTKKYLRLAFCKTQSDSRKQWLSSYIHSVEDDTKTPSHDSPDRVNTLDISTFIDKTLIMYSLEDCGRSIPNIWDGLKESQRKILYSIIKKNLDHTSSTMKVAQLAGYVAEQSGYHHGENNLIDTLIKMAQNFPGKNNISYLYKDGQFGSRICAGKDAANGRYIFTRLTSIFYKIFRKEDFGIYEYINDDGMYVEPTHYVPIIPMILVNGINAAIGTGWSCTVPNYNPMDIVAWIREWCNFSSKKNSVKVTLKPWYKNFKGEIKMEGDRITTVGGFRSESKRGAQRIVITELPINMWTDTYKDILDRLVEEKKIKSFDNYSTPEEVHFVVYPRSGSDFEFTTSSLRLETILYTSNMVTFTDNNKLHHFKTVDEIMHAFCNKRLSTYTLRKKYILSKLQSELDLLRNKMKFIDMVLEGKIVIFRVKRAVLVDLLDKHRFSRIEGSYDYLIDMKLSVFTSERLDSLNTKLESVVNEIKIIEKTSEKEMWLGELQEFEAELGVHKDQ